MVSLRATLWLERADFIILPILLLFRIASVRSGKGEKMYADRTIETLMETGWHILETDFDDAKSLQWKNRIHDWLVTLLGSEHVYCQRLKSLLSEHGPRGILVGTGILAAVKELVSSSADRPNLPQNCDISERNRRIRMRIDFGPDLNEIRESVENGKTVTFRNMQGDQVCGIVVDAKVDPELGRTALTVEESNSGTVYFARYTYQSEKRSCGDIVTWHLKLEDIQELRRIA